MSSEVLLASCIAKSMCSESAVTLCSHDQPQQSNHQPHQDNIATMIGASTENGSGRSLDCNMNQVTQLSSHISLVRCLQEDTDLSEQQIAACVEDGLAQMSSAQIGEHLAFQQHHHHQQQQQQQHQQQQTTPKTGRNTECNREMFVSVLSSATGGHCEQGYTGGHCASFSPTGSAGSETSKSKEHGVNMVQFAEQCYQAANGYASNGHR